MAITGKTDLRKIMGADHSNELTAAIAPHAALKTKIADFSMEKNYV